MPSWWTPDLTTSCWMAAVTLAFGGGMCLGVWMVESGFRIAN